MVLRDVQNTYVVAYKENVVSLEQSLITEGFLPEVIRPDYTDVEKAYSRAVRCMLNHVNVWKKAAASRGLTLVVEADFIPVVGFGQLRLPFPDSKNQCAFGYLYVGGATLFDVHSENGRIYGRGHGSCTVAYIIGPEAALCLMQFAENELETKDLSKHNLWDCRIRMFLQERGINSWVPFRQYGEHGGIPNPEHAQAGFNPSHQADRLFASLHFLPLYARGSRLRYFCIRLKAVLRGMLRLLFGRYLTWIDIRRAAKYRSLNQLLRFAAGRFLGRNYVYTSGRSRRSP